MALGWTEVGKLVLALAAAGFAVGFWRWRKDVRSVARGAWTLSSLLFAALFWPLGVFFAELAGEPYRLPFLVALCAWLWVVCFQATRIILGPLDLAFVEVGRLVARSVGVGAVSGLVFLLGASVAGVFVSEVWIAILVLGFLPALVLGALVGGVYAIVVLPIIEVARPDPR